ncbi:hypothetical protein G9C98_001645 [Cotesia typhae]|uniref:Uncharacterized protein n=1 Tax=Cotesia typhae TaxID=2053667 RepID=A0A8J5QVU7_9HYME|nr:hypothetical protein G9C98_001645 [Cotesia typhae]
MTRYLLAFTLIFIVANVHVLAEDAEDECGANAEINLCGRMCESTCGCRKRNPIFCPGIVRIYITMWQHNVWLQM